MGNLNNDLESANALRILGKYELERIEPYLYRGELMARYDTVSITFDNEWTCSLPLLLCVDKPYGHLCIFHSEYALCDTYDSQEIEFNIDTRHFTSKEFHVICSQIDETHPGFCYIRYALVAICHKEASVDVAFDDIITAWDVGMKHAP